MSRLSQRSSVTTIALICLTALCGGLPCVASAQSDEQEPAAKVTRPGPWFSVPLPALTHGAPAVILGQRGARPVVVPPGEPAYPELSGPSLRQSLEAIVAIAHESRDRKEIGSGQLWGRISGFPSGDKAIDWTVEQWRKAGISDIRVQPIAQAASSSFWLPLSWEVRLLGDPSFGPGTADIVLESAVPLAPSDIPGGTLTAPIVYVGSANPSVLQHIDVKGKVAVQLIVPQGHMVFERNVAVPRARELFKRGAVAVLTIVRLPGNEIARDFSSCGGPCFNVGGRDGAFIERVMDAATAANAGDKVRVRLSLKAESRTGLAAKNAVAVVPGRSDENIIVDAHVDGWYEGAGDNGDGLAVMVGLARHFAKPEHKPDRTLVFVASAGHHSPGLNGPSAFMAANADLAKKSVMMVNLEHVAQRNFSQARTVGADGTRDAVADTGEAPITAGVTNDAPYVHALLAQGVTRYGVNLISANSTMQSGETGGFGKLGVALLTIMQAPPLYHTTGEVLDIVSVPGMERMARFFAFFLKDAGKAPAASINPPRSGSQP